MHCWNPTSACLINTALYLAKDHQFPSYFLLQVALCRPQVCLMLIHILSFVNCTQNIVTYRSSGSVSGKAGSGGCNNSSIRYGNCVYNAIENSSRCLNSLAPQYLSELLQPVANLESRQRLRLSSTSQLVVPCMRRSTIGDCAFTVAAPRAWNSLPDSLHRLSLLEQFKKHLKRHLFKNLICATGQFVIVKRS